MPLQQSVEFRAHENLEALEGIRQDWDWLLEAYPHTTIFSTPEWLVPWWHAFAAQHHFVALAGYMNDRLIGLASLSLSAQRAFGTRLSALRLLGDGTTDSDNLDVPVLPGYETVFTEALLNWMEKRPEAWDVCQFRTMPSASPVFHCMVEQLKSRGWTSHISAHPQSVVELPETWEKYVKRLSANERAKISSRCRKLEKKYKVEIRRCVEEVELDSSLYSLFELHGKRWQERGVPGSFEMRERRLFYRELSTLLLKKDLLELWLLKLNERVVAVQYAFRYRTTVFLLQEGFDPAFSDDSVGYVLRSRVLKALIERGVQAYDFLGGTGQSKMRWGATLRNYVDIEFARPRSIGSAYLRLKASSAETKEWLRMRLPSQVLRTLQGFARAIH